MGNNPQTRIGNEKLFQVYWPIIILGPYFILIVHIFSCITQAYIFTKGLGGILPVGISALLGAGLAIALESVCFFFGRSFVYGLWYGSDWLIRIVSLILIFFFFGMSGMLSRVSMNQGAQEFFERPTAKDLTTDQEKSDQEKDLIRLESSKDSLNIVQTRDRKILAAKSLFKSSAGIHYSNIAEYRRRGRVEGRPYPTKIAYENKQIHALRATRDKNISQFEADADIQLKELRDRKNLDFAKVDTSLMGIVRAAEFEYNELKKNRESNIHIVGYLGGWSIAILMLSVVLLLSWIIYLENLCKYEKATSYSRYWRFTSWYIELRISIGERLETWTRKIANWIRPEDLAPLPKIHPEIEIANEVEKIILKNKVNGNNEFEISTNIIQLIRDLGYKELADQIESQPQTIGFKTKPKPVPHGSKPLSKDGKTRGLIDRIRNIGTNTTQSPHNLGADSPHTTENKDSLQSPHNLGEHNLGLMPNNLTNTGATQSPHKPTILSHTHDATHNADEALHMDALAYSEQFSQRGVNDKKIHHKYKRKVKGVWTAQDAYYTKHTVQSRINSYYDKVEKAQNNYQNYPTQNNFGVLENNKRWLIYWQGRIKEF